MSNEYKDWVAERLAEETAVVTKYPFLRIRDIDGMVDTNAEFPMIHLEIPSGWYKLFFQMCDDITAVLEKYRTAEEFYFLQVKEKYNQLRCYYSNGSSEVEEIIRKYGHISRYVCTICGKQATFETSNYIASFCDDCWKDLVRHENGSWIKFADTYEVACFKNGESHKRIISVKDEWTRYLSKVQQFINYTLLGIDQIFWLALYPIGYSARIVIRRLINEKHNHAKTK